VASVVFDSDSEVERVISLSRLEESTARMPAAAKAAVKKKKAAPKRNPEKIKDSLLVETADPYLPDSEILESAE
jgi:hypothetical protein